MDAIVVAEPEERNEAYKALTGSFEIPYEDWSMWNEKIDTVSAKQSKNNVVGNIIGRRAAKELRVDDIVNIGIGLPEMVSRHTRKNGHAGYGDPYGGVGRQSGDFLFPERFSAL